MKKGILVFWLLLIGNNAAAVQPISGGLWVDPRDLDLSDSVLLGRLLDFPADRLIITCFGDGESLFPPQTTPFYQMTRYRSKADVLSTVLMQAHQKGKQVYVFVDCLHWSSDGVPKERDIFTLHPDWAERELGGSCGIPAQGKYASPFHPQVRRVLHDLVHDLAARYPRLDGILFQCHFPLASRLGFSDAARAAYIRVRRIDPIDVSFASGANAMQTVSDWTNWRIDQMNSLLQDLSATFRSQIPSGRVAAVGNAKWYNFPLAVRNSTLEDWLKWAVTGTIDEVALECRWDQNANVLAFSSCQSLIQKTHKSIATSVLLPLHEGGQNIDLAKALDALPHNPLPYLILKVRGSEDLSRAAVFSREAVSGKSNTDRGLSALDFRKDPRLQVKIALDLRAPKVREVISELQLRTSVPLYWSDTIMAEEPAFGSLSLRNVAAWSVMEQLARSRIISEGSWEKVDQGYRLIGNSSSRTKSAPVRDNVPPPSAMITLLWRYLLGLLPLLIVGIVILFRRRRRLAQQSAARTQEQKINPPQE